MQKPPEIAELEARLTMLKRERKRRHRRANLVFLLAGAGFGTALYLARTRFAELLRSGRIAGWAAIVGAALVVYLVAARLLGMAARLDEEIAEIEAQLTEIRR